MRFVGRRLQWRGHWYLCTRASGNQVYLERFGSEIFAYVWEIEASVGGEAQT